MASIHRELLLDAEMATVWRAVQDVGAVHLRLARGFVVDTVLDGDERVVTFVNGFQVRERIVTIDAERRRLVYAAVGGRTTHHSASFEVLDAGDGRVRLTWTTDLLPESAAAAVAGMVDHGLVAIRATLEAAES